MDDTGVLSVEVLGRRLELTILQPGIVRIHYIRPGAEPHPERGWTMLPVTWPSGPLAHEDVGEVLRVWTSELQIDVRKRDASIVIRDLAGNTLSEDVQRSSDAYATQVKKRIDPDERFFGFGEKTGPLDKRGFRMQMWTTDPWWPKPAFTSDADPLYQSIPFFLGIREARSYGVYLNNTFRSGFDVGVADPSELLIWAEDGDIDYVFFNGPGTSTVVERMTSLVGRMAMPPLWTLGYHQCRWSYAPDTEVREIARGFRQRAIPIDGMWLDIDYMNGFRSFTWHPKDFPEPDRLLEDLEAQGLKTTVIIDPGIKYQPEGGYAVYLEGVAGEHFVTLPNGSLYVGRVWPGRSVFPDFTRKATRDWWAGWIEGLIERGVRGVWIDMNEPTTWVEGGFPLDSVFDGEGVSTDHREARNVYALLMARATHDGMRCASERRPFVLTRAGFAGIQRHAAVWTGDMRSTWDHLQMAPAMLMNMGLSGVSFAGTDVGGFSGNPGPELFARWLQLGSVSPFFRAHVMQDAPRQEPWSFGPAVESISKRAIERRYELLPYLYTVVHQSSVSGAPIVRPLLYEFQEDRATYAIDDQLMLGPFLLAAPVLSEGARERDVYLPKGEWLDYYSGAAFEGPRTMRVQAPLEHLPLFVRGNGILPAWPVLQHVGERTPENLFLDLYPAQDEPRELELFLDDGELRQTRASYRQQVVLETTENAVTVTLQAEQGEWDPGHSYVCLRIHGAAAGISSVIAGGQRLSRVAELEALMAGSGWWRDAAAQLLYVRLPRRPEASRVTAVYDTAYRKRRQVTTELVVALPEDTPKSDTIYLASSVAGWDPDAVALERIATNRAKTTFEMGEGESFSFKVTRGSWETAEKTQTGQDVEDRVLWALGDASAQQRVIVEVARWRDSGCR